MCTIFRHASKLADILLISSLRPWAWIAYPNTPLQAKHGFELIGMVNLVVLQVRQNLCVVENPVGKTYSHVRKATELLNQLNSHLCPMLHKFRPR
jgi:hypothetical protein